jgi:S-DNA-T family DNA segregation ATPase FtsK/SpoIIIE
MTQTSPTPPTRHSTTTGRVIPFPIQPGTGEEVGSSLLQPEQREEHRRQGEDLLVSELPELGPFLATWPALKARALGQVRKTWWHARFHLRRSPRYAGRITVRSLRASSRGVRWWARWVYQPEHAAQLRGMRHQLHVVARESRQTQRDQAAREAALAMRALGLQVDETRKALYRGRGLKLATSLGGAGGALWVLHDLAASEGTWVYPISTALFLGATALFGKPNEDERPFWDLATPPTRVDLAPEHLNSAFRAAGLLAHGKADQPAPSLVLCSPILRDGRGWSAVIDLPRGGGKTAADVLAKRTEIAAELGVDEIQVIMTRVRASSGGHAGRVALWVADDDPYLGTPSTSPLEKSTSFSFWDPIPFGADARSNRVELNLMWQSIFWGGLPRRGKTFSQRLVTVAGILDPWVRHYIVDGKGGADWAPARTVAHRLILGAEDDALVAFLTMLDELLAEMERRFKVLRDLPTAICPESKLTPEIMRRYNLPIVLVTIDELQEFLDAMEAEDRKLVVKKLARLARRGPAAGFVCSLASQRPDAESVPAKLREIITYRYCTQVVDRTSSDMVLGKGKAAQGADASTLSEEHKGVGVLVTGPANHVVVRADYLDGPAFAQICSRGRQLREAVGLLTGDAAGDVRAAADDLGYVIPAVINDVLDVMHHSERMFTDTLLAGLVNLDEETYADWDAERLAVELERAGVDRRKRQVKIGAVNRNGYRRADIEAVVPLDLLPGRGMAREGQVEGDPSTSTPIDQRSTEPDSTPAG